MGAAAACWLCMQLSPARRQVSSWCANGCRGQMSSWRPNARGNGAGACTCLTGRSRQSKSRHPAFLLSPVRIGQLANERPSIQCAVAMQSIGLQKAYCRQLELMAGDWHDQLTAKAEADKESSRRITHRNEPYRKRRPANRCKSLPGMRPETTEEGLILQVAHLLS